MTQKPTQNPNVEPDDGLDNVINLHDRKSGNHLIDPQVIEKYRKTGDCNYPRLQSLMVRLHKGEVLLAPARAKFLIQALEESGDMVEATALNLLKIVVNSQNALENKKNSNSIYEVELESETSKHLRDLDSGINCILAITRKYGDRQKSKEGIEEIAYFQCYLAQKLYYSQSFCEQSSYPQAYFRRIKSYLGFLPHTCRTLLDQTCEELAKRVPGVESDRLLIRK
jgi:hypothetical protein